MAADIALSVHTLATDSLALICSEEVYEKRAGVIAIDQLIDLKVPYLSFRL